MNPIRVLLADDHTLIRAGLRMVVDAEPDLAVVGEANDGREAVAMAAKLKPDVVVMDILLPGLNGIEAARRIRVEHSSVRVLALSNHIGESLVRAILDAGGLGYVRKSRAFEELIPALRAVASGEQYVS